jgi:hypothetical protein
LVILVHLFLSLELIKNGLGNGNGGGRAAQITRIGAVVEDKIDGLLNLLCRRRLAKRFQQ